MVLWEVDWVVVGFYGCVGCLLSCVVDSGDC